MRHRSRAFALFLVLLSSALPLPASAETSPADLLEEIRRVRGDEIATDPRLMDLAERRAVEISRVFDHGELLPLPWAYGEILARNSFPPELAPVAAVAQWVDSPGHAEILFGDWSRVGVGEHRVLRQTFYVAIFADVPVAKPVTVAPRPPQPTRAPRASVYPNVTLPPTDG